MNGSILIVEDDIKTADTLALYLRHGGFRVVLAHDGAAGLRLAVAGGVDLVLLDRMLPALDGVELCRRVREVSDVPILMVTARVAEHDRLDGFAAGVDDYITKPFSPREVLARVQAVLRRAGAQRARSVGVVRIADLVLDPTANLASVSGRPLALSPTEFKLLLTLARAPTKVFSRDELSARVLKGGDNAAERTVDAHVKNLRRKLDHGRSGESMIVTVFGMGYRLAADQTRHA